MRTHLVTGPGGAGTSTVAAATAQRLADDGARVLLVRACPAGDAPPVTGVPVTVPDPQSGAEALWGRHLEALAVAFPAAVLPPPSSVVPLPGAAPIALLTALAAVEDDVDVCVLDAGPVAAATELLALPGALRWWLGIALPPRLRVLAAVRSAATRAGALRRGPVDDVLAAASALEGLLAGLALDDPASTSVHLVLPPAPSAPAVLAALTTELALLGQAVASVTVNRLLPAGAGGWWAARAGQQDGVLAELTLRAPGLRQVPEAAIAPVDAATLRALGAALGEPPAVPAPVVLGPVRVEDGWQLSIPLPWAERGAVELTRWDDDLVVTVAGRRRSYGLDSLLRRCTVAGGRLAGAGTAAAALVVLFAPDAELWPAGLLETGGTR